MILPYVRSIVGALGTKTLEVAEMPHTTVTGTRLPKNPQWTTATIQRPSLHFRGTQLAHAVVKADFLNPTNPLMPGLGFILHSHLIVDWSNTSLCLRPGGNAQLSDFVEKSLSGRLGQGLSILYAHKRGFAFAGHLREILEGQGVATRDSAGRDLPVADFLCEGNGRARCLVEAKASFSQVKNCPKATKATLKDAFAKQVNPWMGVISPPATKSFAIASYLRDHTNPTSDASVLVYTETGGGSAGGEAEIDSLALKRHNYAAWLHAMGFPQAGYRLRSRDSTETQPVEFVVFELANMGIAFPWPWFEPWELWLEPFLWRHRSVQWLGIGMEVNTLRAVSAALQGDDGQLSDLSALEGDGVVSDAGQPYEYSLFPDGTFLGSFRPRPPVRAEEIPL